MYMYMYLYMQLQVVANFKHMHVDCALLEFVLTKEDRMWVLENFVTISISISYAMSIMYAQVHSL